MYLTKLQCGIYYVRAFFQGCTVAIGRHKPHRSIEPLKCVVSIKDTQKLEDLI